MKIFFYLSLLLSPLALAAPPQTEQEAWWTCYPSFGRIEGTNLWYTSDLRTNTSTGETKMYCAFGFRKKMGNQIISIHPLLSLPRLSNVIYTWAVEGDFLLVSSNEQEILRIDVRPLEEWAKRDGSFEIVLTKKIDIEAMFILPGLRYSYTIKEY